MSELPLLYYIYISTTLTFFVKGQTFPAAQYLSLSPYK
jgi:hypothetical protein